MLIEAILLTASAHALAPRDLSQYAPGATVAWVQTIEHTPLLEQGFEHPLVAKILAHPVVVDDMKRKGQDPVAALTAIEAVLGASPLAIADALTSGGFGAGMLDSEDLIPHFFFVMRGSDADEMEDALDTLLDAAKSFGGARELSPRDREQLGDTVIAAWAVGKDGARAALTRAGLLFVATSLEDLRTCTNGEDGAARLRDARKAMGTTDGTFAWIDLDAIEARGKLEDLREAATNAGMHFVLGPVLTYACTAGSLAMSLNAGASGIEVRSRAIGHRAGAGAGTFPAANEPLPPQPARSENEVARAILHRNVPTLLTERTALFPPRAQPGIAEGLANFALLVGGSDAVDELFGSLQPQVLLLAEPVTFSEGVVPDVALPGACLVARLEMPEINGPRVVGAFQSLIALTNVQRAQNGEAGLVLGLEALDGRTMTIAQLPPPADSDGVDLAYNLAPGCVVIGDAVVLGTHHDLVRRVALRLIRGETESGQAGQVDHVRVRGGALVELIRANRDLLVMQQVLNEGKTQSRAELEIDMLASIVEAVDSIEFSTSGTPAEGGTLEAILRVGLAR